MNVFKSVLTALLFVGLLGSDAANADSLSDSSVMPPKIGTPIKTLTTTEGAVRGIVPWQVETKTPDWWAKPQYLRSRGAGDLRRWAQAAVIIKFELPTAYGMIMGHGSGIAISADGWILTNYHVVEYPVVVDTLLGRPTELTVLTCIDKDGRLVRRDGSVQATVYRVDPAHDLALLKLQSMPMGLQSMPYLDLASESEAGQECYMIGSPGGGAPWMIRRCTVTNIFDYPQGVVESVTGAASPLRHLNRMRATVLATDCSISGGDSGGPLINEKGDLVGVTYATPTNASMGSMGFHVSLEHVRDLVRELPQQPEPAPFDVWTAGQPEAFMSYLLPHDGNADGLAEAMIVEYSRSEQGDEALVARAAFLQYNEGVSMGSFDHANHYEFLPYGLWTTESTGGYRFDHMVLSRVDGLIVVGMTNSSGVVDDLRLDTDKDGLANVHWRRGEDRVWTVSHPTDVPAIEVSPSQNAIFLEVMQTHFGSE